MATAPQVLPTTTIEQRRPLYEDIESLLYRGFIATTVDIGNIRIGLRSLFPSDLFLLNHRHDAFSDARKLKSWVVSEAVWILGGQIILPDYNAAFKIQRYINNLPDSVLDILNNEVSSLYLKAKEAMSGAEAFCYEINSRKLWASNGQKINIKRMGAVPGAERLALNGIQSLWAYFNTMEDIKEQQMSHWNSAKLIVSAENGKAAKSLNSKERNALQSERDRRQEVMDRFYYEYHGVLTEETEKDGGILLSNKRKSVEELQGEFWKWVEGEQDFHDKVVENTKNKIRRSMEEQKERAVQLRDEVRKKMALEDKKSPKISPLVGYTPSQMEGLLKEKGWTPKTVRKIHDGGQYENFIYESFLKDGLISRPKEGVILTPDGKYKEVPKNKKSLNEQISSRRVTLANLTEE